MDGVPYVENQRRRRACYLHEKLGEKAIAVVASLIRKGRIPHFAVDRLLDEEIEVVLEALEALDAQRLISRSLD